MVIDKGFEIGFSVLFVLLYQVIADAAVDKGFFDMRQLAYLAQHLDLCCVGRPQDRADLTAGAGDVLADTAFEFLVTLKAIHVGSRSSDIIDDAFEIFVLLEPVYFAHDRVLATASDGTPLMHSDRTKVALSIAAMVRSHRELYRLESSHLPLRLVVGVHITLIAQIIDMVDLLRTHAGLRRGLDEISAVMFLYQSFGGTWLIVGIEMMKHGDKGIFVRGTLFIARKRKVALL